MLFNSYEFLFIFLPFSLLATRWTTGRTLLGLLTLFSFLFYAFAGHVWFLAPMLFTITVDFLLAPRMAQAEGQRRQSLLWISLSLNLGLLFYFKYAGFFLENFQALQRLAGLDTSEPWLTWALKVPLPAGISFYTFQTLSYMIDIYRRKAKPELDFWKFASFVSFYPHLVAGPLTRHHQLIPALTRMEERGIEPDWAGGFFLLGTGLCKKVLLGDTLGFQVNLHLRQPHPYSFANAWILALGFYMQIYMDFSGYSDMALGLGRFFGVRLPENFNRPGHASSPADFWRRWHMTLAAWLRDYLFIPLAGRKPSALRLGAASLATMLICGLWHGAAWNFVLWGGYFGVLLVLQQQFGDRFRGLHPRLQVLGTFLLVTAGVSFFRAESLRQSIDWFGGCLGAGGPLEQGAAAWLRDHWRILSLSATAVGYMAVAPEGTAWLEEEPPRWAWAGLGALSAAALAFVSQSSSFLYFKF